MSDLDTHAAWERDYQRAAWTIQRLARQKVDEQQRVAQLQAELATARAEVDELQAELDRVRSNAWARVHRLRHLRDGYPAASTCEIGREGEV